MSEVKLALGDSAKSQLEHLEEMLANTTKEADDLEDELKNPDLAGDRGFGKRRRLLDLKEEASNIIANIENLRFGRPIDPSVFVPPYLRVKVRAFAINLITTFCEEFAALHVDGEGPEFLACDRRLASQDIHIQHLSNQRILEHFDQCPGVGYHDNILRFKPRETMSMENFENGSFPDKSDKFQEIYRILWRPGGLYLHGPGFIGIVPGDMAPVLTRFLLRCMRGFGMPGRVMTADGYVHLPDECYMIDVPETPTAARGQGAGVCGKAKPHARRSNRSRRPKNGSSSSGSGLPA